MKIPTPTLRQAEAFPHHFYSFFGTVDRQWRRNEWMFAKVGIATNVHRRLVSYRTHCPIPFSAGIQARFPTVQAAKQLETAMLDDPDLSGFRSQGEWFVIMAGPEQHVLFIKDLLARFYIERFRNKELWSIPLEWVILPDRERISEIPNSNEKFLNGPENGTGFSLEKATDIYQQELALAVRAEAQAEAIGRLLYPELEN